MALTPTQEAAAGAITAGSAHLVLGVSSSGKTTTAVEAFTSWLRVNGPDRAVFLVPTRQRASHLRPLISRAFGGTTHQVLVRTPASLAFGILHQDAVRNGRPAPSLIPGPEQDRILADLIEGHLAGEGHDPGWPDEIPPAVFGMRAFRDELRDLLMRAAEAGLDGETLTAVGQAHGRPEWVAAGNVLTEYTQVTILGELTPDRGARYDAATILDRAIVQIHADPTLAEIDLLIHDDYQDATLATGRLLGTLAERGTRLGLFANPDTAVQGFRGGVPALTHTAHLPAGSQEGAFGADVHILDEVFTGAAIWSGVRTLSQDLPPLLGADRRKATVRTQSSPADEPGPDVATDVVSADVATDVASADVATDVASVAASAASAAASGPICDGSSLACHVLGSVPQEIAFIARSLRERHVLDGVAWGDMAVIVRGHRQLGPLRRALTAAGVPVRISGADVPLREEPAVRALLTALIAATSPGGPDLVQVTDLLTSSFGGSDSVGLRRLRRALRQLDPGRSSGDLLLDALADPELRARLPRAQVPAAVLVGLTRIAGMITAGRDAAAAGDGVELVLWAIWDAAGLATTWQERALGTGAGADRADADLDATVALFLAAERFVERRAGASARAFADHLAEQDFPADTLAARAGHHGAVALHTPASAAGSHWPVVIVAGVNEDTWPDLRLRDTLLGAAALADLATRRHGGPSGARSVGSHGQGGWSTPPGQARRDIFHDELRTFISACSRSSRDLLITAVLDADTRPSSFFERLVDRLPEPTEVPAPLDLRGLVGQLRRELHTGGERSEPAAALLLSLADAGVPGAHPVLWAPELSSAEALADPQAPVRVSPSAIEAAVTCPLNWFLTTHGGRRTSSRAQDLGTLIHSIADAIPVGTEEEYLQALDERWHELDLPDTHLGRAERTRAESMLRKLAAYVAQGNYDVESEIGFTYQIGRALVSGRVDRVEHRPSGAHVVDLKTGTTTISAADAKRNPQLAAYQVAVRLGALGGPQRHDNPNDPVPTGGASLLYLGTNHVKAPFRSQAPLQEDEEPTWAEDVIVNAAEVMAGSQFPARPSDMCRYCPVRSSCPALAAGSRLAPGTPTTVTVAMGNLDAGNPLGANE